MFSFEPRVQVRVLDPRLHQWGLPRYQTPGSAGIDLHACLDAELVLQPQAPAVLIPSGLAMLMEGEHMAAFLLARSGLGHGKGLVLGQAVGTIDADYQAEILISAWLRTPPGSEPLVVRPGERVAQLVFVPVLRPAFELVDAFDRVTARGEGGFGSTGV